MTVPYPNCEEEERLQALAKDTQEDEPEDVEASKKRGRESGEDDDDLDDDEELLYAQALTVSQDVQDEQEANGDRRKRGRTRPGRNGLATAAPTWSASFDQAPALATSETTALSSTSKRKRAQSAEGNDGAASPLQGATAALPHVVTPGPSLGATTAEEDTWSLQTWGKCEAFSVALIEEKFQPPPVLTKEAQKTKWKAELGKIRPFLEMMERFMCADGSTSRVKDSEIKAAFKAFKACGVKVDRKLEYTAEVGEVKIFSSRVLLLKDILQGSKDLKDMALCCGKSGTCSTENLKKLIDQIHASTEYFIEEKWLSFPVLWVQARTALITFDFKSFHCFSEFQVSSLKFQIIFHSIY